MKNKLENIKIIITCQYKLRVNVINIITPLLLIMASYYWILCTRHGFKRHVRAVLSCFSYVQLFVTPWTVACHISLSMEFFRQEYWCGFPFPPPGDLPNPGIKPISPLSPVLLMDSLHLNRRGRTTVSDNYSNFWLVNFRKTKQSRTFIRCPKYSLLNLVQMKKCLPQLS